MPDQCQFTLKLDKKTQFKKNIYLYCSHLITGLF